MQIKSYFLSTNDLIKRSIFIKIKIYLQRPLMFVTKLLNNLRFIGIHEWKNLNSENPLLSQYLHERHCKKCAYFLLITRQIL